MVVNLQHGTNMSKMDGLKTLRLEFAPGVVGCTGAFQIAVALWKQGSISSQGVARVASDLKARGVDPSELGDRLRDMGRRALVEAEDVSQLVDELAPAGLVPSIRDAPPPDPKWQAVWRQGPERLWTPPRVVGE